MQLLENVTSLSSESSSGPSRNEREGVLGLSIARCARRMRSSTSDLWVMTSRIVHSVLVPCLAEGLPALVGDEAQSNDTLPGFGRRCQSTFGGAPK